LPTQRGGRTLGQNSSKTQEQGVDHDRVAQLVSTGAKDGLAVEQRLADLFLDRVPCEFTATLRENVSNGREHP
jgi:hypothetical protein